MRKTGVVLATATLLGMGAAQPVLAQSTDRGPAGNYAQQRLDWQPCLPDPPPGLPDGAERMQCATLTAPLDWNEPRPGENISIAVSKLPARDGAGRALLTNPGGPGGAGLEMPLAMLGQDRQRVLDEFDIYGIDVRGTGASSTVSCGPQDANAALDAKDRSPASIHALLADTGRYAADCQEHSGELGRHVNTEQTVHDLDLLRQVEQRETVSFYGVSGGTWLGAYYATYFPDRVDRSVLDSNTQFTGTWQQVFSWQPMAFERRWTQDLRPWLASADDVYGLGATPEQVQRTVDDLRARLKQDPIPAPEGELDHNALDALLVTGLYGKSEFPAVGEALGSLRAGDTATGAERLVAARSSYTPMQADEADSMSATFYNIQCNDTPHRGGPASLVANSEAQGRMFPLYGYHTIIDPCAFWERPDLQLREPTGAGAPPALMLQSENDPATAVEGARIAHDEFADSRMVTVRDEGDHGVYGAGNECVDRTVEDYLVDGRVPERDLTCEGMPLPEPGAPQSYSNGTNKNLIALMDELSGTLH